MELRCVRTTAMILSSFRILSTHSHMSQRSTTYPSSSTAGTKRALFLLPASTTPVKPPDLVTLLTWKWEMSIRKTLSSPIVNRASHSLRLWSAESFIVIWRAWVSKTLHLLTLLTTWSKTVVPRSLQKINPSHRCSSNRSNRIQSLPPPHPLQ